MGFEPWAVGCGLWAIPLYSIPEWHVHFPKSITDNTLTVLSCKYSSNPSISLPKFTKVNVMFVVTYFQKKSCCKVTQIA